MGRKKKKDDVNSKPYCWYCDRTFDDDRVLSQHKKMKHFKCHICYKQLPSGEGLFIHVYQVHRETMTKIPNAKPGRDSVEKGEEELSEEEDGPDSKKQKTDHNPTPATVTPLAALNPPVLPVIPTPTSSGLPAPLPAPPTANYNPYLNPYNPRGPPPPQAYPGFPPQGYPGYPPQFGYPPPGFAVPPPNFAVPPPNFARPPPGFGVPPPGLPPSPVAHVQPQMPSEGGTLFAAVPGSGDTQVPPIEPGTKLIYEELEMSPEERRANLSRYAFNKEKMRDEVKQLNQSIESRLAALMGSKK